MFSHASTNDARVSMLRDLMKDVKGNMIVAGAVALVPVMGAIALAVDFSEMNRHKAATLNALDTSGIATARYILNGATNAEAKTFAKNFFEANLVLQLRILVFFVMPLCGAGLVTSSP
jgi:Flp pilus assembly protein TadG